MRLPHSFIILLSVVWVNGSIINTTVDDSSSSFTFVGTWNTITPTSPCDICSSKPDPSQTLDGTWHDGNIRRGAVATTGSFTFQGSAVYIFGIDQAESQPNIAFTLGSVQSVHHYTGTEQFVYNALFFSATGLSADQTHTVNWEFDIADTGVVVQAALFDYAIVTSGEENTVSPTTSPTVSPTVATTGPRSSPSSTKTLSNIGSTVSSSRTTQTSASASGLSRPVNPTATAALNESSSPPTVTVDGTTTATSTPQSTASHARSNLAAIIGGAMAALVVAALVILLLFLRSRRLPRIHPETDKDARSQFLRIEDYPLNSLPKSADAQEIRHPITQSTVPSTYSLNPLSATSFSTTALLPQTPSSLAHTTDAEPSQPYPETEPPARIDTQPSRDSGYRILEERLATLEAQVAVQQLPPPYVHRD